MKALLLALLLVVGDYYVEKRPGEFRIVNQSVHLLKCYAYYSDGEVDSIYVRPGRASLWQKSQYLQAVSCY